MLVLPHTVDEVDAVAGGEREHPQPVTPVPAQCPELCAALLQLQAAVPLLHKARLGHQLDIAGDERWLGIVHAEGLQAP